MRPDAIVRVADLLFEVRGGKAAAFLHGQLTGHIKNLAVGQAGYNFLLNAKGKIQTDLHVARLEDSFLLSVVPNRAEVVISHLQKLAPLSQVQIEPWPDRQLLHFVSQNPPESGFILKKFSNARFLKAGFDAVLFKKDVDPFEVLSDAEAELLRIYQGVPRMDVDFTSENLPQETGRYDALHFDKGCYLGQEIVTRLEHRGHVNRQLVRFEGSPKIVTGSIVKNDQSQEVGRISSVGADAAETVSRGLCWLAWKTIEENAPVFCADTAIRILPIVAKGS